MKSDKSVIVDTRLRNKIETLMDCSNDGNESYLIKFKDIQDSFWFNDWSRMQDFLNNQVSERYFDKELRKGYFDYINEYGETLRYYIQTNRGTLTLLKEECIVLN